MEKHSVSRLSYLFAHLHLLSSDSFSSLLLSSNLSLLSASALLCFSSVHIVGSLTSKLPSKNLSAYAIKLKCLCHKKTSEPFGISQGIQNPPEPYWGTSPSIFSAKPSGTSQGLCTGTFRKSQGICPGTLRNLTTHLQLDPPEPHQVAAPETSGTSQGICTGTLRNCTEPSAPEPSGTLSGTWC